LSYEDAIHKHAVRGESTVLKGMLSN